IGLAAPDSDRPVPADELAEPRKVDRLELRDVVEIARRQRTDDGDVDPMQMVDREHDAAFARHVLAAVRLGTSDEARRNSHIDATGRPEEISCSHAGWRRARTISSICSTTSSTWRVAVSISGAPAAGRLRAASLWW